MACSSVPIARLTATGTAVAAAVGALVGPAVLDGFPLPARLFFGGLGGPVIGALIGVVASALGCAAAVVVRASGQRLALQRIAFTVVGTAAAVALAVWSLSPEVTGTWWLVVGLGVVTASAGTALARRFLVEPPSRR